MDHSREKTSPQLTSPTLHSPLNRRASIPATAVGTVSGSAGAQFQVSSSAPNSTLTSPKSNFLSTATLTSSKAHIWKGGIQSAFKRLSSFSQVSKSTFPNQKYESGQLSRHGNLLSSRRDRTSPSILFLLTLHLKETYSRCNPQLFNYDPTHHNPRRVLTKPSEPTYNEGFDNADSDYILYVNDVLGDSQGRQYLILDLLGHGTFGQVVKCRNVKTGQHVAIKVIKNKPAYFNQSKMEITILDMLNNVFDPHDRHNIARRHLCLVFEVLSVNLYELIKQNQFRGLSIYLVRLFTVQILDALVVLNEARIIHCDLKPENILLKNLDSPSIKVIDFGSACHENQTVYTYIQSRFYRSPEVLLGLPYSSSIDLWSLGCITAELFLGLPLLPGASEYNQISRIIEMFGMPPSYMLDFGKNTRTFFNKTIVSGRPQYTLKTIEQYNREKNAREVPSKRYFQTTNLPNLIKSYSIPRLTPDEMEKELNMRDCLIDFLSGLLNLNPLERWSPQQARYHPFITGAPYTGKFVVPYELGRMFNNNTNQFYEPPQQERGGRHMQATSLPTSPAFRYLDPQQPQQVPSLYINSSEYFRRQRANTITSAKVGIPPQLQRLYTDHSLWSYGGLNNNAADMHHHSQNTAPYSHSMMTPNNFSKSASDKNASFDQDPGLLSSELSHLSLEPSTSNYHSHKQPHQQGQSNISPASSKQRKSRSFSVSNYHQGSPWRKVIGYPNQREFVPSSEDYMHNGALHSHISGSTSRECIREMYHSTSASSQEYHLPTDSVLSSQTPQQQQGISKSMSNLSSSASPSSSTSNLGRFSMSMSALAQIKESDSESESDGTDSSPRLDEAALKEKPRSQSLRESPSIRQQHQPSDNRNSNSPNDNRRRKSKNNEQVAAARSRKVSGKRKDSQEKVAIFSGSSSSSSNNKRDTKEEIVLPPTSSASTEQPKLSPRAEAHLE